MKTKEWAFGPTGDNYGFDTSRACPRDEMGEHIGTSDLEDIEGLHWTDIEKIPEDATLQKTAFTGGRLGWSGPAMPVTHFR